MQVFAEQRRLLTQTCLKTSNMTKIEILGRSCSLGDWKRRIFACATVCLKDMGAYLCDGSLGRNKK